jgi:hypothetical protein
VEAIQTTSEKCTLHFFDLPVSASDSEKQKMEEQKKLLLNWYTSQNFYNPDNSSIKWEVKHHVISFLIKEEYLIKKMNFWTLLWEIKLRKQ